MICEFLMTEGDDLKEFAGKLSRIFPNYEQVDFVIEEFSQLAEMLKNLGFDSDRIRYCTLPPFAHGFPRFHSGMSFYFGLPRERTAKESQPGIGASRQRGGTLLAFGGRMENLMFDPNFQGTEVKFAIGFKIRKDAILPHVSSEAIDRKLKTEGTFAKNKLLYEKLTIMLASYQSEKFNDMLDIASELWRLGYRVVFNFKDVISTKRFYDDCSRRGIGLVLFVKPKMRDVGKVRVKYLLKDTPEQDIAYSKLMAWLTSKAKYYDNFSKELESALIFRGDN
jgi:hypothetical protein